MDYNWIEELEEPAELFVFKSDPTAYRQDTDPRGNRVYLWYSRFNRQWMLSTVYIVGVHTPELKIRTKSYKMFEHNGTDR